MSRFIIHDLIERSRRPVFRGRLPHQMGLRQRGSDCVEKKQATSVQEMSVTTTGSVH